MAFQDMRRFLVGLVIKPGSSVTDGFDNPAYQKASAFSSRIGR